MHSFLGAAPTNFSGSCSQRSGCMFSAKIETLVWQQYSLVPRLSKSSAGTEANLGIGCGSAEQEMSEDIQCAWAMACGHGC